MSQAGATSYIFQWRFFVVFCLILSVWVCWPVFKCVLLSHTLLFSYQTNVTWLWPWLTKRCQKRFGLNSLWSRAYFSMQLIPICAVVKSRSVQLKKYVCTKKCRDSGQNDDLCAAYQVLCSCKSCLKYALWWSFLMIPWWYHIK